MNASDETANQVGTQRTFTSAAAQKQWEEDEFGAVIDGFIGPDGFGDIPAWKAWLTAKAERKRQLDAGEVQPTLDEAIERFLRDQSALSLSQLVELGIRVRDTADETFKGRQRLFRLGWIAEELKKRRASGGFHQ